MESQISLVSQPTGFGSKHPMRAALKHMTTDEQRTQVLATAEAWKERFSEAKWMEVACRIERFKKEDHIRILGRGLPSPIQSIVAPGGRKILLYSSSSSLTAPTGAHRLRPAHLPRIDTTSPTTPRPRWDVVSAGPVTPLSATPVKNAFAEGGFWASLTPKTPLTAVPVPATPITATPIIATPITAIPLEPWVPSEPTDPEAKAAYEEVKKDVTSMALKLCASRLALHPAFNPEHNVIHPSMVKPKDELHAAEFTLESRQIDLAKYLDTALPEKIDRFADEEAMGLRQYSINSGEGLVDIDTWLRIDEKTLEMTTVLDAQREVLRMNRNRRKNRELALSEQGARLAWATKVLNDAQYIVDSRTDGSSAGSDEDEGYDYSNFVRSLRRQWESDLGSLASQQPDDEFALLRSSAMKTTTAATNVCGNPISRSREATLLSLRSSSSPVDPPSSLAFRMSASPTKPLVHGILPLREREVNISSSTANFTSTHSSPTHRSNATATSHHRSKSRNLNITTDTNKQGDKVENAELSPEEKGFRHQGPSFSDLDSWADELRKMEVKRAALRLSSDVGLGHRRHLASRNQDEDLMGSVHPALRRGHGGDVMGGGGSGSSGSSASWKCETAVKIEREYVNGVEDQQAEEEEDEEEEEKKEEEEEDDPTTPKPLPTQQHQQRSPTPSLPPHHLTNPLNSQPPPLPPFNQRKNSVFLQTYNRQAATSHARQSSKAPAQPFTLTSHTSRPTTSHTRQFSTPSKAQQGQHIRSKSSTGIERVPLRDEGEMQDWVRELRRMESRERVRQVCGL
ncbi:hypothetical protein EJ02DRAFT_430199 [Clathrospora elynae]|uniref:Uncharacterized protein n=1 Tax=Clathrospora elynae TaxID=706981 RepID=A0A6A5T1Z0_9PLEO|nr:hypothetical protein EJ02DRAFT_430199 [Clathrospora elynae]